MGKKITTETFLKKVKEKFGETVDDLSKVEYTSSKDKVIFVCPKHGEYYMLPCNYLNGQRCPKCKYEKFAEKNKKYRTNEDFIEALRSIHGDKYDYSKVEYKSLYKKVIIIYQQKEYKISPCNLLKGCEPRKIAAQKISKIKSFNTEQFIEKARKIHGDKYDYSKVNYVNSQTPVCIILHEIDERTDKEYGEFWQKPNKHLNGCGHPKLSGRGYTREEMIYYFNKIHNKKYDYSKFVYPSKNKVSIICPEHGEFWQTIHHHLCGEGCPCCGGRLKLENKQFIERLQKLYGDKYDYSKVNYVNSQTPVKIVCQKHGDVESYPLQLYNGGGCKKCKNSVMENEIEILLKNKNINFIPQCNCKTLRWLGKQSLDFFLPEQNTAIECQGCEHFRSIDAFKGEKTFQDILRRDEEKRNKTKENNVKLVYYTNEHTIPSWIRENFYIYFDRDKMINDILNNVVKDIYYETSDT